MAEQVVMVTQELLSSDPENPVVRETKVTRRDDGTLYVEERRFKPEPVSAGGGGGGSCYETQTQIMACINGVLRITTFWQKFCGGTVVAERTSTELNGPCA